MNYNHDKQVKLSYSDLKWFINEHLDKSYVEKSLKKLGFVNTNKKENIYIVPKWRLDIERQENLIEEITKNIDINKLSLISIADNLLPIEENVEWNLKQQMKSLLLNNHFFEIKIYNLINKNKLPLFNLFFL